MPRPARRRPAAAPTAPTPPGFAERPARGERVESAAAVLVMALLVVAVYVPVRSGADENTLYAIDYHQLHARRIEFARNALFGGGGGGTLPAWYPRELMGTPFWSNVQNFPFIPTRLALLGMDTHDLVTAGVMTAAVLAAAFTFLFGRQIGMTRVGAAAAGWTFACAGFFASRVLAGHLPLLEAYPALPLLLWRVEACVGGAAELAPTGNRFAFRLGTLALATLCVVLAGHPQLPLYAVGVAGLYLLYRGWHRWQITARAAAAMAVGAACGAFALWPMVQLVARSTRVLALDPAANDIPLPYGRLIAFVLPWSDGWPDEVLSARPRPFAHPGGEVVFWDTVCYVGVLPLLAVAFLAVRRLSGHARANDPEAGAPGRRSASPWIFFAVVGVLALVAALPAVQQVTRLLPGTFLRSPARQLYVTTFALALAAGVAADVLLRRSRAKQLSSAARAAAGVALGVLLLAHFADLARHARAFVRMVHVPTLRDPPFEQGVRQFVGDGRVGIDVSMTLPFNRELDDPGFFESIMLAKPYAALMDLAGRPAGTNVQHVDASELPARALAATGTRLVMTTSRDRPDLRLVSGASRIRSYAVPNPLPRAAFLPASAVLQLGEAETHARLRDPAHDVGSAVMLRPGTTLPGAGQAPSTTAPAPAYAVAYARPWSDEIVVRVRAGEPGVLRVLESWDPGWSATANGVPVDVLCADDAFLAVALPPGEYEVRFAYATPGAATGIGISLASLCLLAALLHAARRRAVLGPA